MLLCSVQLLPNVNDYSDIMVSAFILNAVVFSIILLNVVWLSVVLPECHYYTKCLYTNCTHAE